MYRSGLLTFERVLFRLIIVPFVAFLPAPLAYSVACRRGDLRYWLDRRKREEVRQCLEGVLGDQLSPAECTRVTRDFFRLRSCEAIDVMRLAGKGRALARLVEIRGLEHIDAALTKGKGAILCSGHFGTSDSCFSLIGACGYPVTVVARWVKGNRAAENRTPIELFISKFIHRKLVERHRHRPNIEPQAGQLGSAIQVASILRQNEVVVTLIDPPALAADRARTVSMKFLNGQARLLPGTPTIAKLTGAPVLMIFLRRSQDWHHLILEVSPPIPMDGDTVTSFERCLASVEATIRQHPAHWVFWNFSDLVDLGLLPSTKAMEEPLVEASRGSY